MLDRIFEKLIRLFHSLSWRLGILTTLWVGFVSISSIYTIIIEFDLEQGYSTISHISKTRGNVLQCGQMLAQNYSQADFMIAINELDQHIQWLNQDRTYQTHSQSHHYKALISSLSHEWSDVLKPQLIEAKQSAKAFKPSNFTPVFKTLDNILSYLEDDFDKWTSTVRLIQWVLITITLFSLFVILFLLKRWVVEPTHILRTGFDKLTRGDLSVRLNIANAREFEIISENFNNMATRQESLVNDLEARAQQMTVALQERNRNLSQLYQLASYVGRQKTVHDICEEFTVRMIHYTGASACAVMLVNATTQRLELAAHIDLPDSLQKELSALEISVNDISDFAQTDTAVQLQASSDNPINAFITPQFERYTTIYCMHAKNAGRLVGVYVLFYTGEIKLSARRKELYENFGSHLAASIASSRLHARDRELAVIQERNFLARGLHDSIAQSLSFMNLQVQLLKTGLQSNDKKLIDETVESLQIGVQESYDDVRELLTNFRERLHQEPFEEALQSAANRFTMQTRIPVKVFFKGNGPEVSALQKLQITFIVQEALANVRKHAQATEVTIVVENGKQFTVRISDNGIGIDSELVKERQSSHFGLNIMRERAERIGATVRYATPDSALYKTGTTVEVTIPNTIHSRAH